MGKILCATRGGEASYRTQDAAIKLAKERGDTLLYMYVVDLHFLDKTAEPIVTNVEDEFKKMADFLLLMAKERAAQQGVIAETICRRGEVRDELKKVALEEDVSMIVLGRPAGKGSVFKLSALETFAARLEAETGLETRIV